MSEPADNVRKRWPQVARALAFFAPNMAIFAVFTLVPVIFTLVLAFFEWDPFTTARFVGFDNFNVILADRQFWYYLLNTLVFMLGLPLSMAGSLFLAVMLSQKLRAVIAYRTAYYLPSITNGVALFLLWKVMYNKEAGLVNALLLPVVNLGRWLVGAQTIGMDAMPDWLQDAWSFPSIMVGLVLTIVICLVLSPLWLRLRHLPRPAWLGLGAAMALVVAVIGFALAFQANRMTGGEFYTAKPALVFMNVWTFIGGANMILYLAALAGVPTELYEAAEIDGAGRWRQFKDITWPMIAPTTFFIFVMGMIGGLQGGFEMAFMMTEGGPDGSTTTVGYHIFSQAFFEYRFGYAAAISFILFLLVMAVTMVNWRFGSKAKGY